MQFAMRSIERLLPHAETAAWLEQPWKESKVTWASPDRRAIRVRIGVGAANAVDARSLSTSVVRRRTPKGVARTLDNREHDICRRVALETSRILDHVNASSNASSLEAIRRSFDERVVAAHVQDHHGLALDVAGVLHAMQQLAQQTYENKAISFGCMLDPQKRRKSEGAPFPHHLLGAKKYRALTDGFRTAYHISSYGRLESLVDLLTWRAARLSSQHFYPEWSEPLAVVSRAGRCGISLTKNGDILVFDEGNLRFTHRYGRWQYWNHRHLIDLLKSLARVQRVPPALIGQVVSSIYRTALDVSFRRSGALLVVLRKKAALRDVVRLGDAIGDQQRDDRDKQLDDDLARKKFHAIPRTVASEIAGLDGAIVLSNTGELLAYGAVLNPRKTGRLRGTEGSRTKAAIGASNYGLAVKVSSDGDITVFAKGQKFLSI